MRIFSQSSVASLWMMLVSVCCGVSSEPYIWNKTAVTAERYLADYEPDVCGVDEDAARDEDRETFCCFSPETFPCDCGEHCHNYGTCCSDRVPGRMTQAWSETTGCLEDKTYAMVRCPQSWGDGDVREACETGQGKYTVDEPVTDLSTNVTFRNAFCAQCHGVESYTAWEFNVTCLHFQFVFGASSQEEFLDKAAQNDSSCSFKLVPPDQFNTILCPWHGWFSAAVVDTCNVTGGWATDDYDADVEKNCLQYKSLVLRVKLRLETYQNLFCAVCNGVIPERRSLGFSYEISSRFAYNDISFGHPPLSLLLGLQDSPEAGDGSKQGDTCPSGQWRDHSEEGDIRVCGPHYDLLTLGDNSGEPCECPLPLEMKQVLALTSSQFSSQLDRTGSGIHFLL
ncbi:hypothetical protein BaRGS_00015391 [Batillaria attramentaria]|uniref:SMB domain-containing protein n=1 Tax=Batillaria attramentaria TaxID=370345 RepID=A0ABD0L1C4_9CAEN